MGAPGVGGGFLEVELADVERLARWALANEYGKKLEASGPLSRELKIDGAKALLVFDHVGPD